MERFQPLVQKLLDACEGIQVALAREEPLTTDERDIIEMSCLDLLAKLHRMDKGPSSGV